MTVAELIALLKTLDPTAEVVACIYDNRSEVHQVLELRRSDVRAISMRELSFERPGFDVDHGARLYQVDDDGPVQGVEIG
ncbi:MAG: hypothetical protein RJA34_2681 [Pseudomonadota bacterium]|jgi:hypothetical protein